MVRFMVFCIIIYDTRINDSKPRVFYELGRQDIIDTTRLKLKHTKYGLEISSLTLRSHAELSKSPSA